ncbi:MAG: hypothetical protein KDD03_10805 [Gelidibacter sp.]|nr:hypothetical protein [Gelidibacter sp.]
MREKQLMEYIKIHKLFLLKKMEVVSDEHESFYCYFDINYTTIKGTTSKIVDNKVIWVEARPEIRKKDIDSNPSGFINAGELPPEK